MAKITYYRGTQLKLSEEAPFASGKGEVTCPPFKQIRRMKVFSLSTKRYTSPPQVGQGKPASSQDYHGNVSKPFLHARFHIKFGVVLIGHRRVFEPP